MGFVTVERVQPGMVVSAPVVDRRGRLLIPPAVPLTERHIQALQVWGVAHVEIEGEADAAETESTLDPAEADRIRAEIEGRFGARNADHALMVALRECAFQRAAHSR